MSGLTEVGIWVSAWVGQTYGKTIQSDSGRGGVGLPRRCGEVGRVCRFAVASMWMVLTLGCGNHVRQPTQEQWQAFEKAGTIEPAIDMDRIEKAKLKTGPYRVVAGDVLEFTMPALLQAVTASEVKAAQNRSELDQPYLCRVDDEGAITLPAIGSMLVGDRSLAEIEKQVTDAYRDYVTLQPSVFVRVSEYETFKVYITGAVNRAGVYTLRADQMTLSYLLTQAGGISEAGAAVVRIVRSDASEGSLDEEVPPCDPHAEGVVVLPVVNADIPFRDAALDEGDTVVVEPIQMPVFSVLGLVNDPGNYPYPPGATYNVTQAIAFAGGLDPVAEPRHVTVYRLGEDDSILRMSLQLVKHNEFTDVLGTRIRPGDVVAVEHTVRTRVNTLIRNLVRINTGLYLSGRDLWDGD